MDAEPTAMFIRVLIGQQATINVFVFELSGAQS